MGERKERLPDLTAMTLMEGFDDVEDKSLSDFAGRRQTYDKFGWPHSEDSSCNADKMADAGFYMVESNDSEDLARCFYCRRELDGWEEEDDPWQEHKRRPCPFIKKGKLARNLTVKDQMELEAERVKIITQKRLEIVKVQFKELADKKKLELETGIGQKE